MKWAARIAALYFVTLVFMFAIVALAGDDSVGHRTPSHVLMNPVSHSDYELHKSIGHLP